MALTKKQFEAISDLFETGGDESKVLEKHKIQLSLWLKWQRNKDFTDEISRRMRSLDTQGQILIAKYRPLAIAHLISLCSNENSETSRKACLDMVNFVLNGQKPGDAGSGGDEKLLKIKPETASKLLAVLAEDAERRDPDWGD
jgi:hypothetical protein